MSLDLDKLREEAEALSVSLNGETQNTQQEVKTENEQNVQQEQKEISPATPVQQEVKPVESEPWEQKYKTLLGINKVTAHENAQLRAEMSRMSDEMQSIRKMFETSQAQRQQVVSESEAIDPALAKELGGEETVKHIRKAVGADKINDLAKKVAALELENSKLREGYGTIAPEFENQKKRNLMDFRKNIESFAPNYWTELDVDGSDFDAFIRTQTDISGNTLNDILNAAYNTLNIEPFKRVYEMYANVKGLNKKAEKEEKLASKISATSVKSTAPASPAATKEFTMSEFDTMSSRYRKGEISKTDFDKFNTDFWVAFETGKVKS